MAKKFSINQVWIEIKNHRGWYLVVLLLSGLPVYLATLWDPIMGSKTVPVWLAENGWPRLITLAIAWTASRLPYCNSDYCTVVPSRSPPRRDRSGSGRDRKSVVEGE